MPLSRVSHIALIVIVALLIGAPGASAMATPSATPAAHPSCADLESYVSDVLIPTFTDTPIEDQRVIWDVLIGSDDFTMMRPNKLRDASAAFDRWAVNLEESDPDDIPVVAQDFHDGMTQYVGTMASVTNAIANNGPVALFGYAELADEIPALWEQIHEDGRGACGDAWDVMQAGEPIPLQRP